MQIIQGVWEINRKTCIYIWVVIYIEGIIFFQLIVYSFFLPQILYLCDMIIVVNSANQQILIAVNSYQTENST